MGEMQAVGRSWGEVTGARRSRVWGQSWQARLFLSCRRHQPSSQQMFMAANAMHQGWAHSTGERRSAPALRSSTLRGGASEGSRWIPGRHSAMETGEGAESACTSGRARKEGFSEEAGQEGHGGRKACWEEKKHRLDSMACLLWAVLGLWGAWQEVEVEQSGA